MTFPKEGLVNYWELEETSGDVVDSQGTNTGTNVNCTRGATGKIGNCFSFDGNDYITLSELPFSGSGNFSIFAWIKTSDDGGRRTIINFGANESYQELYFYKGTDNKLHFDLRNYAGVQSSSVINSGEWVYVGVVNTGGAMQLWINGSQNGSPNGMNPNIQAGDQTIGASEGGTSHYWDGEIDEMGIWTRALTKGEIRALFNSGKGLPFFSNPNKGTKGTKEINKNYPFTSGLGADDKHEGRQINLTAEGINGIKSFVSKKNKVLL